MNKLFYLFMFMLFNSSVTVAGEYVPPPPGPYQSTVIINKNEYQSDNSGQVYKFPSENLIQHETADNSTFVTDKQTNQLNRETTFPSSPVQENPPAVRVHEPAKSVPPANQAADDYFATNPWSSDSQTYPDAYQRNRMNPPPVTLPQQNPYGYNNQNDFMIDPFNRMPSPWTPMPMQPPFSGR